MARLDENKLVEITRQEVEKYAGVSDEATAYPILDNEHQIYAVNAIRNEPGKDHAWLIVQARVVEDKVIVDEDNVLDKNLVYALIQARIPREQIVLAYTGEKIPTEA
jgi:hypothetical protein